MISQLEGIIKFKTDKFVVIDVSGVGYQIFVGFETLKSLKSEQKALLWTHLNVRENALDLYGFLNYAELEFFRQLIQISGIGPKNALSVLDVAPLDVLRRAISSGEKTYLTKVSGIGQRLAEKIVIELKDKLGSVGAEHNQESFKEEEEALEALRSLGYSLSESRKAIRDLPEGVVGVESIVKKALKNVSKN